MNENKIWCFQQFHVTGLGEIRVDDEILVDSRETGLYLLNEHIRLEQKEHPDTLTVTELKSGVMELRYKVYAGIPDNVYYVHVSEKKIYSLEDVKTMIETYPQRRAAAEAKKVKFISEDGTETVVDISKFDWKNE